MAQNHTKCEYEQKDKNFNTDDSRLRRRYSKSVQREN